MQCGSSRFRYDWNLKALNYLGYLNERYVATKRGTQKREIPIRIKKLKDFAELSSDELIGGFDEIKGKRIKINGYLEDFALSREEADNLIMNARKIVFAD